MMLNDATYCVISWDNGDVSELNNYRPIAIIM